MAVAQETVESFDTASLETVDPEIAELLGRELERQREPDRADRVRELHLAGRARGGRQRADEQVRRGLSRAGATTAAARSSTRSRQLAIERAKELFGAEHANVQPHAGAQANMAVYFACLQPGDTILSLELVARRPPDARPAASTSPGGSTRSSTTASPARRTSSTTTRCSRLAKEHRPKLIVCGGSAYPRTVDADALPRDRRRGRRAAHVRHGALRRSRRRGPAAEPRAALRLRHVDDAQDARRAALRLRALPRGARAGARPRRLPGHAGRAARAHDRGEGGLLPHRRDRGVPRLPAPGAGERRRARRDADRERARRAHRRHRHAPPPARPARAPSGRARTRRSASTRSRSRSTATRSRSTSGRRRSPRACASARPPRRCAASTRTTSARWGGSWPERSASDADLAALAARSEALCERRPLYPGFRGYDRVPRMSAVATGRLDARRRTRSSSTSSRTCATRPRRPSTSASS